MTNEPMDLICSDGSLPMPTEYRRPKPQSHRRPRTWGVGAPAQIPPIIGMVFHQATTAEE